MVVLNMQADKNSEAMQKGNFYISFNDKLYFKRLIICTLEIFLDHPKPERKKSHVADKEWN